MKKLFNLSVLLFVFILTSVIIAFILMKINNHPFNKTVFLTSVQAKNKASVKEPLIKKEAKEENPTVSISSQQEEKISPKTEPEKKHLSICQEMEAKARLIDNLEIENVRNNVNGALDEMGNPIAINDIEFCLLVLTQIKLTEEKGFNDKNSFSLKEIEETINQIAADYQLETESQKKIFVIFQNLYYKLIS